MSVDLSSLYTWGYVKILLREKVASSGSEKGLPYKYWAAILIYN